MTEIVRVLCVDALYAWGSVVTKMRNMTWTCTRRVENKLPTNNYMYSALVNYVYVDPQS